MGDLIDRDALEPFYECGTDPDDETDFSGFVRFVGTNAANAASKLHERDRIKLGDVDVTTFWQAEKKITYTNYACFNFEKTESNSQSHGQSAQAPAVDDGEVLGC